MPSRAEKIREYILKMTPDHPADLVDQVEKKFDVTRTTIHRHITKLIEDNKLIKTGRKKGARYYLPSSLSKELKFTISEQPEEHQVWDDFLEQSFSRLKPNVKDICYYGFGEMFNNAVDHSEGGRIKVHTEIDQEKATIVVYDDGIGIFKKIQNFLNLDDIRESVLHLTKGKLTTDPDHHSGEGIYFSSRAFDSFSLLANGLLYLRENSQNDWFLEDREGTGTLVRMEISTQSDRELEDLFKLYQNTETQAFDKTHILVRFSQLGEERFVSRSQAKRILRGLEKFKHIILDFKGIRSLGQAFVDEVFRVFKKTHPEITIEYINAEGSVKFMIQRGLSTAQLNE